MNERNKNTIESLMMPRSGMTREQRYSLNIVNPVKGDKVSPERIENPLNLQTGVISSFLEFSSIATPSAAPGNNVRLYTKSSGSASKMFVIDSTGAEKELITSASLSLDSAYNLGSTIAVDSTNVFWRATGTLGMYVQNSTGTTDYWSATSNGVIHDVVTYLNANTEIDGALSIISANYLQFRDSAISISSQIDGELDIEADGTINLRTGNVFIEGNISVFESDTMTVNGNLISSRLALHDDNGLTNAEIELHRHTNTAGAGAIIYGARSRGTGAAPTVVSNNDDLLIIGAVGHDGTDYAQAGIIKFEVDGTPGNNDMPGRFVIQTTQDGAQVPTEALRVNSKQSTIFSGRIQGSKGADVASATTITLGNDGNYFDITGTTTIDYITTTDWQAGSEITLQFDSSLTVTHNGASPGASSTAMRLAGAANFSATSGDTLTLIYDGTYWREKARTVI